MIINGREIMSGRSYIIADVGSNFNGSLDLAKEYIHAGKEIGVDAVKFQSYRAESLLNTKKPDGERWNAFNMLTSMNFQLNGIANFGIMRLKSVSNSLQRLLIWRYLMS